jgi:hypothetical protein
MHRRLRQGGIGCLVIALHGVLLHALGLGLKRNGDLFHSLRSDSTRAAESERSSVLLLIPQEEARSKLGTQSDFGRGIYPIVSAPSEPVSVESPSVNSEDAQDERRQGNAPDWRGEAERVAREHAAQDSASQGGTSEPAPPTSEPFPWSRSSTKRIERMEDGNTIFWVSERCFLVNFIVPGCQLGKVEPRGDLFEHMEDERLGDWKD